MKPNPKPIEAPNLSLKTCSVDEHCEALISLKYLPYWWYQGSSKIFGNYSLPFQDSNGNWWYQAKPGFCWLVETYKSIEPADVCLPYSKSFIGYQHIVSGEDSANSQLIINTNLELNNYGSHMLKKNRRKNIRNGLKSCLLTMVTEFDEETLEGCRLAWSDLTVRTGWKKPVSKKFFDETWRMLLDCPGVSTILARERSSGEIAGFFIVKIIGDTVCGDTISVRSDMLYTKANDALRYTFLINAAKIPGVTKACCSIRSNDVALEQFKMSIGYKPTLFPVNTHLRFGLRPALKFLFRDHYDRMIGQYKDEIA